MLNFLPVSVAKISSMFNEITEPSNCLIWFEMVKCTLYLKPFTPTGTPVSQSNFIYILTHKTLNLKHNCAYAKFKKETVKWLKYIFFKIKINKKFVGK